MSIDERLAHTNFSLPAIRQVNQAKHKTGISLGLGELKDFPVDPLIKNAIANKINSGAFTYTHNAGLPELRIAVAESYSGDNGFVYSENNVLVTIGVQNALYSTIKTLAKLGAKRVLIPEIFFGIYKRIPIDFGLEIKCYKLSFDFGVDLNHLNEILRSDDIVIINSPSNPTGRVFSLSEQQRLASLFDARLSAGYVISDEIYSKLVYQGASVNSFIHYFDRTIVLDGVSKSGAVAGLRVGWVVAKNEKLIKAIVSNNATVISSPPTINQFAALPVVKGETQNSINAYNFRLKENCDYVSRVLLEIGIPFIKPRGSFYIFPDLKDIIGPDTKNFCLQAASSEKGVVVIPGAAFGAPSHIRISLASNCINEGIDRFKKFLLLK